MVQKQNFKSTLSQLETTLSEYLVKKAPALPTNVKDILVMIIPWFTLLGVIISIPLLLAALGLSAVVMPFAYLGGYHGGANIISLIVLLVILVLQALSLPGLFKRQRMGWEYAFYAALVGVVNTILTLTVGGIIGTIVSFYILFQVREYYK